MLISDYWHPNRAEGGITLLDGVCLNMERCTKGTQSKSYGMMLRFTWGTRPRSWGHQVCWLIPLTRILSTSSPMTRADFFIITDYTDYWKYFCSFLYSYACMFIAVSILYTYNKDLRSWLSKWQFFVNDTHTCIRTVPCICIVKNSWLHTWTHPRFHITSTTFSWW